MPVMMTMMVYLILMKSDAVLTRLIPTQDV
jgi:hypothetical protein